MNALMEWVLGYLVNSLWQVPVVFVAAWVISRIARRMGPRMEHLVWVGALVAEIVVPACSLHVSDFPREIWSLLQHRQDTSGGAVRVTMGAGMTSAMGVLRLPETVLMGIGIAYGCSLLYFAGRLAWGLWRTDAMRRRAKYGTLTDEAAHTWERYRALFNMRTVEVAMSPSTAGPVTVGMRRGVMLVPSGFLERIAEGDLDAVMAHELAHMQRRDFAKNVAYGVLSLPVAYHPLLWLTRSWVAATREMVCDAMAAEAVAGRERYARSLLRLASLLVKGEPVRTLHAIGIFDANIFERRVMKLTERRIEMKGVRRIVTVASCALVGLATCASAMALRMDVGATAQTSQAGTHAPLMVDPKVMAKQVISRVNPVYPKEAKAAHVVGAVVLHAVISKEGSIQRLTVISGPERLRASAVDSVKTWKYKPYLLNGNPVEVSTIVTVTYSLQN